MARIKRSSIDDVRQRVSIQDVVSPYVNLKKAGAKWKGLSPFTQEKSASFFVDPAKGLYYCFSSGQGGDIFKFVQTKENLGFQESVEALAQRFAITLEYEEGEGGPTREGLSLRKVLFDLHEAATAHFHACFLKADAGGDFIRKYWLESRRFDLDLAKEFKIGWAPADGGGLLDALVRKKFTPEALKACGLFFYREGERDISRGRPRFRGRLMIPIRDIQGRVIAFTARQTEKTPEDDPAKDAKYVNSPETPLFRKGDVLFNLDRAHTPVKDSGRFLLVEGQLDALRCWSTGLTHAVAPQGTALTENQFYLMRRYTGRVDCLLDGDAAGQRAALRALPLTMKAGMEIRFLVLPPESDPDELLLEKGAAALTELDKSALSAMQFAVRSLLGNPDASAQEKSAALRGLFEILAHCESAVMREDYLEEGCRYLRVDRTAAGRDFNQFMSRQVRRLPAVGQSGPEGEATVLDASAGPNDKLTTAEYELLMLGLHYEYLLPQIAQVIDPQWIDNNNWAGRLLDRCLAAQREDMWPGTERLEELFESDSERHALANLLSQPLHAEEPVQAINQCLKAVFEQYYRNESTKLKTQAVNTPLSDQATLAAIRSRMQEIQQLRHTPPKIKPPAN